jgi:hypothetical protein
MLVLEGMISEDESPPGRKVNVTLLSFSIFILSVQVLE